MIVSEYQWHLHEEGLRLLDRLRLQDSGKNPAQQLPAPFGFLHLVPALHAIVDWLEKLERAAAIEKLERVRFTEADVAELKRLIARADGAN